MSLTHPPLPVVSTLLCERPDGTRILTITTKTGPEEFLFSAEQWLKLAETAQWFETHVTTFPEEVDDAQAEIDMDAGDERRDCLGLAVHGRSTGWEP